MDYETACEAEVSRDEARQEIERHDVDGGFAAFLADCGDHQAYQGAVVLDWLGY